jgi:hypothetical protein
MTLCRSFNVDWVAGLKLTPLGATKVSTPATSPAEFFEYSKTA